MQESEARGGGGGGGGGNWIKIHEPNLDKTFKDLTDHKLIGNCNEFVT